MIESVAAARCPTPRPGDFCGFCYTDGCNDATQYGPVDGLIVITVVIMAIKTAFLWEKVPKSVSRMKLNLFELIRTNLHIF